ncbi:MAG: nuclear transport factor 2 family protein [Acidimicrobiales bacterium]
MDPGLGGDDLRAVIELELALLSPQVRRSREMLESLLEPDFFEVGASGKLWTRSEMLGALTAEEPDDYSIEVSEIEASPVGEGLVLVSYVSSRAGRRARRSSLWRESGSSWQIIFHQGTLL